MEIITKVPGVIIEVGSPSDNDPLWDDFVLRQEWLHKHDDPEPEPEGGQ